MSSKEKNLASPRKNLFYYIMKFLAFVLMKILFRFKVKNADKLPDGGFILCSNHTNALDPVILGAAIKNKLYYMAKEELIGNGLVGFFLKQLGAFPIKRGSRDKQALETAKTLLESGGSLCIFIEGTRSKTGELLPPKSGAVMLSYRTNSPIVPVSISQHSGKPISVFNKVTISIGETIPTEELSIVEGKSSEYRNASRMVMGEIKKLREEDIDKKLLC